MARADEGELILEYKFNETGVTAPSTGSTTTALTLYDNSGTAADLHTPGGDGVSGLPFDRAFDNSASPQMGKGDLGGFADGGDIDAVDTLISFTLSGWFKTAETTPISNGAALFWDHGWTAGFGRLTGFGLTGGSFVSGPGSLTLSVGANGLTGSHSLASFGDVQSWVFFAVTYDGTPATHGTVRFYKGTRTSAVSLLDWWDVFGPTSGPLNDNTTSFRIGNREYPWWYDFNTPFDGYLDNIRVHGSTTDGSGALSLASLEAIRAADVLPEPEPSEVDIDIKPGSDPNSINLGSNGRLPVAILSNEDFDALWVDEDTVLLADPELVESGAVPVPPIRSTVEDVDGDGLDDLLLFFYIPELAAGEVAALGAESTGAVLVGETFDGIPMIGADFVRIVPPKGRGKSGK